MRGSGPLRRFARSGVVRADFEVRSTAPVPVGLDGEALILDPPLRFASLPGALRVRLPRTRRARPQRSNAVLTRAT